MQKKIVESVPCLVTPEWTAAAASHTNNLQTCSSTTTQLWQEAALLEQLMYKNTNQHRDTRPFQRLTQTRRFLRLAKQTEIDGVVAALRDAMVLASKPTLTLHERSVPTVHSAVAVLRRLLGCCRLLAALANSAVDAAAQFTTQLAQSFFMPLSLTCLAIVARIRALSSQLLVDCIRTYNTTMDLADILPFSTNTTGDELRSSLKPLPHLLKCSWIKHNPVVEEFHNHSQHDEQQVSLQSIGSVISLKSSSSAQQQQLSSTTAAAAAVQPQPVSLFSLAVVEDRGLAVSRDELMAELRRGAAVDVPLIPSTHLNEADIANIGIVDGSGGGGDVVMLQEAPEYSRHETLLVSAALGEPGSLLNQKQLPQKKKRKAPKIIIVDDDGGGVVRMGRKEGKLEDRNNKSTTTLESKKGIIISNGPSPTAAAAVPQKMIQAGQSVQKTAFIRIDMQQKDKKEVPASENKSWEDWLAPLGGVDAATGDGEGKKKKKKRRKG